MKTEVCNWTGTDSLFLSWFHKQHSITSMYTARTFCISDVEITQSRQEDVHWFSAGVHTYFISDLSTWVPAHQGSNHRVTSCGYWRRSNWKMLNNARHFPLPSPKPILYHRPWSPALTCTPAPCIIYIPFSCTFSVSLCTAVLSNYWTPAVSICLAGVSNVLHTENCNYSTGTQRR